MMKRPYINYFNKSLTLFIQLNTPDGIKWYKCSSDGERQYYIEKLKRKINPELVSFEILVK